jgi:hypothetical protein
MSSSHGHGPVAPSGPGTVVLEIGGASGALVVHASPALAGRELEIARRGEAEPFVHTEVRERRLPDGTVYAAVFASLPQGAYTLLEAPAAAQCDVAISSGRVTEVTW